MSPPLRLTIRCRAGFTIRFVPMYQATSPWPVSALGSGAIIYRRSSTLRGAANLRSGSILPNSRLAVLVFTTARRVFHLLQLRGQLLIDARSTIDKSVRVGLCALAKHRAND